MKNIVIFLLIAGSIVLFNKNSFSQANTTLSNLSSPTSVNVDLIPNPDNTRMLGSASRSWRHLYIDGSLYLLDSLFIHNRGTRNSFAGRNAGFSLTTGVDNASLGYRSLYATTSGYNNTAAGSLALNKNTTATGNSAFGKSALQQNTNGNYNTAVGGFALYNNTNGERGAAIGYGALYSNTSGYYNTGSGFKAMYQNTSGSYNVAAGNFALYSNATGSYNTANGSEAMYASTGSYNVASGYQSLYYNISSYNTAEGAYSLNGNTAGSFNKAGGFAALYLNTTGSYNTGIGSYALYSNVSGSGNTAVGYFADVSSGSFSNATALGYNAVATASNQVMLGNPSVTSVRCAGSVVIYSDGRFKKNLQQNVPGLEFVKLLTPVTYTYDVHAIDEKIRGVNAKKVLKEETSVSLNNKIDEQAMAEKEKKVYTGLIAQDVEKAAEKLNYDFSGVYRPQNDNDVYGLSYTELIMPMIKAIQQLSEKNEELEEKVERLQAQIAKQGGSLSDAVLKQNTPNPFTSSTMLSYFIPSNFKSAYITITDMKGSRIKTMNVSPGPGQLTITRGSLAVGYYTYTLYIDGVRIDAKQMIVGK